MLAPHPSVHPRVACARGQQLLVSRLVLAEGPRFLQQKTWASRRFLNPARCQWQPFCWGDRGILEKC